MDSEPTVDKQEEVDDSEQVLGAEVTNDEHNVAAEDIFNASEMMDVSVGQDQFSSAREESTEIEGVEMTVEVVETGNETLHSSDETPQATSGDEDVGIEKTQYSVARTFDGMREIIEQYSTRTVSVFVVSRRTKDFGSSATECDLSKRSVMWEEIDCPTSFGHEIMKYNGVPFMSVGAYYLHCQFGVDQSKTKKQRRNMKKETGELVVSASRNLNTPTKKCGCPANIVVKQIIKFPDFRMERKTEYLKKMTNKRIRDSLKAQRDKMRGEIYYVVKLPPVTDHKFHELLGDNLTSKEPVLKELRFLIQDMALEFKTCSEIMTTIYTFVENTLFHNQSPPERCCRKYFPQDKDIRNMADRIRQCCVFSDDDQLLMANLVERLEEMGFNILFRLQKPSKDAVLNTSLENSDIGNPSKHKKLLRMTRDMFVFVLQTPSQAMLLRKYGGVVYVVEANQIYNIIATRTLTFRVQLLFVQTNVDFQLVGCFLYSKQQLDGFIECMRTFKSWNEWWTPKYFITEMDETVTQATSTLFPESDYYLSDEICERKWAEFLQTPSNNLVEHADHVFNFLKKVQESSTQDALHELACDMEASIVWISNEKLQQWFHLEWLANAKRWVVQYRPDDLFIFEHGHTDRMECVKGVIAMLTESTKTGGQVGFVKMLERLTTKFVQEQYVSYTKKNQQYYLECLRNTRLVPHYEIRYGIPMSLVQSLQRVERDLTNNIYNVEVQQMPGVFTVTESQLLEEGEAVQQQEFLVSFGDNNTCPGCTCVSWSRSKLPCAHMFIVFQTVPQWKYDALCPAYRLNKCLAIDFSCFDFSSIEEAVKQGFQVDVGLQVQPSVNQTSVSTQKSSGSLFRKSENLPASAALITDLKAYLSKTLEMERIFDDRELFSSLCKDLRILVSRLEKRIKSNCDTTQLKSDFVSLTSLFNCNKNSVTSGKISIPDPGSNLGICKKPVSTKVVSIEKQISLNNLTDTSYKPKLRGVKDKNSTPISATTDSLTGVECTPNKDSTDTNRVPDDVTKSASEIRIVGRKRNASGQTVMGLSLEVANAVNILTNSSIHSKKVNHNNLNEVESSDR